jgi:hypothetical protein
MNLTSKRVCYTHSVYGGHLKIFTTLTEAQETELNKLYDYTNTGGEISIEVKKKTKKRSLDANAYMWVLLHKMADVLGTTKDELYLQVLERYGVFTHVIVRPAAVERMKQEWRTIKELGEVTVNGVTGVQLQCYYGSSTYTTTEMAKLIDGVVSECKELNIETLTPDVLARIKSEWGV